MKHLYLWVIVCFVVGTAFGLSLRYILAPTAELEFGWASELDPTDPKYKEVMCGPASLSVALGRVGVFRLSSDIAAHCKVTSRGVSIADLERDANAIRTVHARIRRLRWDELCGVDGAAVLFVKGNHFLAVDPRRMPGEAETVRIYEPEKPMQPWTRQKLEKIWEGEALVITRRASSPDDNPVGSQADWDQCYIDQGVLTNAPHAHYRFSLRNAGGSELVIGPIDKSCGCTKFTLSQERLAPGESAVIETEVDLQHIEGHFQHHLIVTTNDSLNPTSILRMAGGVAKARVLSSDLIHLGELPQGGRTTQKFYVGDPGYGGFKILKADFVSSGNAGTGTHLTSTITYDLLGEDAHHAPSGFRAKPTDYVVQLAFEASSTCPLGLIQGEVKVVLEADGLVTTHTVALDGTIVRDVHPVPRVALITLDAKGFGSTTIRLNSHSNRKIEVVKTWSDSPNSLEIQLRKGDAQTLPGEFGITARISNLVAGSPPLQQIVSFEMADGSVVSVPVAVFMPPQKS